MLTIVSGSWAQGDWVAFHELGTIVGGVTKLYSVMQGGERLGEVRWFGRWRKYAFFPLPGTLYEENCMRDIADFCVHATKLHRQQRKEAKTAG